ncbi:ABC transporter ATP-binding protein [Proteiniborus sp. MB09-C3]|uniref:ABC transporter ATP-binding protein n=1 Tax=Proteiniborus sp. MB09-C3 TaxID=3050072 RepID=UPI0025576CAD|nr:ABC transporter ATP-binding protein [Proteiniborus sp. MB09-C3]WIV11930.1 ABC transporter ATP-binding protein [Proteiniborus sp. MB09-C3]
MKIEIRELTKDYSSCRALDNISITFDEGIHGLLGPNGAGKTTFIRILSTLLPKTSGEVYYNNIKVENKKEIRRIVGYLPQEFSFYPNFTVYETLDYFASLSNINLSKKVALNRLEIVNLQDLWKVKTKALSGGMKRRLGIAVAIVGDPEVLIVDEPTAGLDPEERIRVRNMLSQFGKTKTVLLSTHIVEDIALSCKSLSILNKGRLVYNGTVKDVIKNAEGYVWDLTVDFEKYEQYMDKYNVISSIVDGNKVSLRLLSKEKPSINAFAASPTLEDAYMRLIKEV